MNVIAGAASRIGPGVALCLVIALFGFALQAAEEAIFGHPYVDALVIAILAGIALRTCGTIGGRWLPGIAFSAKTLLEIAVMLLGATVSIQVLLSVGPGLLAGIALVVLLAIGASYGIGRGLGLSHRLALLVACGNSICGNSAIAAVAPVIGANGRDIASSIAFTAVLGVIVVLSLPMLVPILGLSATQYGVLAGLTVYAVPQVLAATAPVAMVSVQMGTIVKLVRVLMLGPVVVALSLMSERPRSAETAPRLALMRFVPWFILGFLGLAALRSFGLVPQAMVGPLTLLAKILTVVSMAALGLGVDLRVLRAVGGRVTAAAGVSLVLLVGISLGLIRLLGIG
ncbi:YeiH family protein [Neoroseomonas soli]|uniref:YeiH family putative sulfate export transporter n=1 Tax=Neoroseomonas soli TaxID=1081025 RepID=A0A9X9WSC6_9PROT|nr:YeiH family protein [Neoroseomonas soli]MBR0670055.1 YeiH family putative sulfate export transporter [Neoroseomonas soli]